MIRISTIFIAICMVLVAASLGLILYSVAGISGTESAIVALAALTVLILYNAVSMRLRDRSDVGGQIADLSRGTADLARQVAEYGRRRAATMLPVIEDWSPEDRRDLLRLIRKYTEGIEAHREQIISIMLEHHARQEQWKEAT